MKAQQYYCIQEGDCHQNLYQTESKQAEITDVAQLKKVLYKKQSLREFDPTRQLEVRLSILLFANNPPLIIVIPNPEKKVYKILKRIKNHS